MEREREREGSERERKRERTETGQWARKRTSSRVAGRP